MDSFSYDTYFNILFFILGLANILMWYFYGTIDSINYNNIDEEDTKLHNELKNYIDIYHTHLIVINMLLYAVCVYIASYIKFGYIYCALLLIITIIMKHLGYYKAEKISNWMYNICNFIYKFTLPITILIEKFIKIIAKIIGIDIKSEYSKVTEDEIISIINDGHEQGILEKEEVDMINNIVELGEKEAMDIMTHRKNVFAIDIDTTIEEIFNMIISTKYSRYPVYDVEIDKVIGILHIRDFLKLYKDANKDDKLTKYMDILRKPYFIPNTKDVNDIFKDMQKDKSHMAVVIDEFGQLDGILTMEDIIEEIMGNILDEYDQDETMIIEQKDGIYLVRGICTLEELSEKLGIEFDEEHDTLNGFLVSKLNRIPKDEESSLSINYLNYKFSVKKIKNKVIQLVKITRLGG